MNETKLWINGQWQEAKETYELTSPYNGEIIAKVAKASVSDVEQAIEGAQNAFLSFKQTTAYDRAEILYKVVDIMRRRKDEMAEILAQEAGKPISAGLPDIEGTIATYEFAAEASKQVKGETAPMDAAPAAGGLHWLYKTLAISRCLLQLHLVTVLLI
ncbi:Aldehyde dehydrogenase OS=Lysinibacillus sphaericus OX=1421 GN=LS41612_00920 PE=3 SV=1 [Lysinibacillus sphaericus]